MLKIIKDCNFKVLSQKQKKLYLQLNQNPLK